MSDMSFNQAKEIVERLELAELSLRNSFDNIDHARRNLDDSLIQQKKVIDQIPIKDKKISILYIIIMLNVGFIAGLLIGKFLI